MCVPTLPSDHPRGGGTPPQPAGETPELQGVIEFKVKPKTTMQPFVVGATKGCRVKNQQRPMDARAEIQFQQSGPSFDCRFTPPHAQTSWVCLICGPTTFCRTYDKRLHSRKSHFELFVPFCGRASRQLGINRWKGKTLRSVEDVRDTSPSVSESDRWARTESTFQEC